MTDRERSILATIRSLLTRAEIEMENGGAYRAAVLPLLCNAASELACLVAHNESELEKYREGTKLPWQT